MSTKGGPVFTFSLPGGGGSPPCRPVSYVTALTLDIRYRLSLGYPFVIEIQTYARTGVLNLLLTMYPFSISTDEYVSLSFLMTKKMSKITKIH